MECDVLVVGGGHAGIEAAFVSSHLNKKVILLTLSKRMIGNTPCNPHIGGSAKGIVVREIDALGGMMGILADHDPIQVKILNRSKGPGVRCLRAQVDKYGYPAYAQKLLDESDIEIVEAEATSILYEGNKVLGVKLRDGREILAKSTVLTTGTYMDSRIIRGQENYVEGPDGEKASVGLSSSLREMGFRTRRLKTGTPPRIDKNTIDFSAGHEEPGEEGYLNFSYLHQSYRKKEGQLPCHLIYTTPKTLQIIRENIEKSALFNGNLTSVGPRYCPSIESKVTRFSDKPRHQLFLEPETWEGDSIYLQGFSTGFPKDIQEEMVHSLPGLEHAKILKYAYQIEYDCLDSLQFDASLASKDYFGLYVAGQILGTSGYEEAAGLGFMAGLNASRHIDGLDPVILKRDEAYIGVMIDDLVTKGTDEPYRLLSSRAEHRLLLRHDNADKRLTPIAIRVGTCSPERQKIFNENNKLEEVAFSLLGSTSVKITLDPETKQPDGSTTRSVKALEWLKRPEVSIEDVEEALPALKELGLSPDAKAHLETDIKFEGYIKRAREQAEKLLKSDSTILPSDLDYSKIDGLRLEAREKLNKVRPLNLGQAARVPGVNPADVTVLMLYLKKKGVL